METIFKMKNALSETLLNPMSVSWLSAYIIKLNQFISTKLLRLPCCPIFILVFIIAIIAAIRWESWQNNRRSWPRATQGCRYFFSSRRSFCHQIDSYNGTMFPCDKCQSHFSLLLFPEAKSLDNMHNILNWQSRRHWESPRRRWRGRRGGSRLSRSSYSVARWAAEPASIFWGGSSQQPVLGVSECWWWELEC